MRKSVVLVLLLAVGTMAQAASKTVHLSIEWTFDSKHGLWTSRDTGISLPKKIAGFRQNRAEPAQKDGSASFGYSGTHGVVTIFIEHRLIAGFDGTGDCTSAARDNYLQVMHKSYGKTDSEQSFQLAYNGGGKRGRGVATLCHFRSFPGFDGRPVYSEVAIVLIGDFLLECRGTFIDKAGVAELNVFCVQ